MNTYPAHRFRRIFIGPFGLPAGWSLLIYVAMLVPAILAVRAILPARSHSPDPHTPLPIRGVIILLLLAYFHSGENPVGLFRVFLVGVVFTLALWRTGSLWWAIGFHMAWDWAQSFLYGVPDSGVLDRVRCGAEALPYCTFCETIFDKSNIDTCPFPPLFGFVNRAE